MNSPEVKVWRHWNMNRAFRSLPPHPDSWRQLYGTSDTAAVESIVQAIPERARKNNSFPLVKATRSTEIHYLLHHQRSRADSFSLTQSDEERDKNLSHSSDGVRHIVGLLRHDHDSAQVSGSRGSCFIRTVAAVRRHHLMTLIFGALPEHCALRPVLCADEQPQSLQLVRSQRRTLNRTEVELPHLLKLLY